MSKPDLSWMQRLAKAREEDKPIKPSELPDFVDLCSRCHRLKTIQRAFTHNKSQAKYRIQGPCDRCGAMSLDLWPMMRKNVLDVIEQAIRDYPI